MSAPEHRSSSSSPSSFLPKPPLRFFAPTYSIRDASRELGRQLAAAFDVRTVAAASLFLDNTLRYRERACNETDRDDQSRCDAVVVFEHNLMARKFLRSAGAANLDRIRTFPVKIHPHYRVDEVKDGSAQIALYARRPRQTATERPVNQPFPSGGATPPSPVSRQAD